MEKGSSDQLWSSLGSQESVQVFNYCFKMYYTPVFRFVLTLVKNNETTEDITQDTFAKAWQRMTKLDSQEHFKNFVFEVALNKVIDHFRKKKRRREGLGLGFIPTHEEMDVDKEKALLEKALYQSADALPEKCKEIFLLYFGEDKKTKEIAEELGITPSLARNRKKKALDLLRNIWGKKDSP